MSNSTIIERIKMQKAETRRGIVAAFTVVASIAAFSIHTGFEKRDACAKINNGLEDVLNSAKLKDLFKNVKNLDSLSIKITPTAKDGAFTPFLYVFGNMDCPSQNAEIKIGNP